MKTTILIALILSGCSFGPSPETYPPARTPSGATGEVRVRGAVYMGELLEARDSALVLRAAQGIVHVPFRLITRLRFTHVADLYDPVAADFRSRREQLRLVSRFPYGLSPEVWERLLATQGQAELIKVQ